MSIKASGDSAQSLTWRRQWLGLLFLGILALFTWLPYSYYRMVAFPWTVVWQLGFLSLGIWAIGMLRQIKLPFKTLGYGFDGVVGISAIALTISAFVSEFPQVSIGYVLVAFNYGLLLYVLHNWLGYGLLTWQRLWAGLALVGIVAGAISFGGVVSELILNGKIPFNSLPFGHRNFVAGYFLLILPLIVALAWTKSGWQRILLWGASVMLAVNLYTTHSRGGMLGILIVCLACLGFGIIRSQGKHRLLILLGSVVAIAIVVSIILSSYRVQQIISISFTTNHLPSIELKIDGSAEDRLFMMQTAFNIFRDRPLLGVGAGNTSRIYNLYRPIEAGAGAAHVQQLHNTPIHLLGELGLISITTYLLLWGCFCRLWLRLYQQLQVPAGRLLLYGIGASWLGYSVSSLTDYQLENIGISSTIIILLILLISLADEQDLTATTALNHSNRRWLSVGIASFLIALISIWLPVNYALYLAQTAHPDTVAGKLTQAYNKLTTAASLVPSDPTYPQLIGLQLWQAQSIVERKSTVEELRRSASSYLELALKAAPYDVWFNHNLGIVYQDIKPEKAEAYFSRAIQLQPRDRNYYEYYYLGNAYLAQGKTDRAIQAFALQGLVMPEFLTYQLWSKPSFADIHGAVVKKAIALLETLLKQIPTTDTNYRTVYEQIILLRWWHKLPLNPLNDVNPKYLRPIVRALLLAETSPDRALAIVNQALSSHPSDSLLLLRAWLEPEKYLQEYINNNPQSETKLLKIAIKRNQDIRSWLASIKAELEDNDRVMDVLIYRNPYIAQGKSILVSKEIKPNYLVNQLGLFPSWSRTFPTLDRLIEQVKAEKLGLIHSTKNQFQLTPSI